MYHSIKKRIACALMAAALLAASGCTNRANTEDSYSSPVLTPDTASAKTPSASSKVQTDSDKPGTDSEKAESKAAAESVILSESELVLTIGENALVAATVMPTTERVLWSSSDDSIATVDDSGLITAAKVGTCTIKAEAAETKGVSAQVKVTVKEKESSSSASSQTAKPSASSGTAHASQTAAGASSADTTPKKVTSLTLSLPTTVLMVGQVITPTVTVTPTYVDNAEVTLSTSDDSIVSINDDGSITANAQGACTLTATSASNKEATDSIILTVTIPIEQPAPTASETDNGSQETPSYQDNEEPYTPSEQYNDYPREECYIDGILIVNKTYSLPASYNPGGLTPECAAAFERLRQGAAQDGVNIWLASGFRSYEYQSSLYWGYVSYYGQAAADTFSARPGHSEHQTGMAIDCNIINDSFAGTREAIWLENHCHEYGFIIRYPYGKQSITGYKYEPWHIRYIGDKATEIAESGLTLEEYYGITSVYGG